MLGVAKSLHLLTGDVSDKSECQCAQWEKGRFKSNPVVLSGRKLGLITDGVISFRQKLQRVKLAVLSPTGKSAKSSIPNI